jgi:hypothetical protein
MTFGLGRLGLGLGKLGASNKGAAGVRILLSGTTVAEDAAVGTDVGTASISASATGTAVWSLTNDAGGLFSINSSTGLVEVAGALDYETAAAHLITVAVSGTTPDPADRSFIITVTDVSEGGGTAGEPIGLLLILTKAA